MSNNKNNVRATSPPRPPSSLAAESGDSNEGGVVVVNNEDWRKNVTQQYRNDEIKEIAKFLAALEPGASSASKLKLASVFEKDMFTKADSLSDYRKKLNKRLKKLKKTYQPTTASQSGQQQQEQRLAELKRQYGETLQFIAQHADDAVKIMTEREGPKRAQHLKQHTDNARQWAKTCGVSLGDKAGTAKPLTMAELKELQTHMGQRVDNIRSHVVRLTQPDLFISEKLDKIEPETSKEAALLWATVTQQRLERLGWKEYKNDTLGVLIKSLEKAQTTIPPFRSSQQKQEALLHLEKMRAASQALLAYTALSDKTVAPRNTLVKCHNVATQGLKHILQTMQQETKNEPSQQEKASPEVTLEDAWTKVLEAPTTTDATTVTVEGQDEEPPTKKQRKLSSSSSRPPRTIIRSRVLLTAGRKTPFNLLPALRRKRAELVRPPPDGHGSHLILEFGNAFIMTIHLVPLLVTISPQQQMPQEVSVFGVTGSIETLGHVVAQRLRFAQANATRVLRICFASATTSSSSSTTTDATEESAKSDYDVEISEATALLQFLQIARTTYMPQWQDEDV